MDFYTMLLDMSIIVRRKIEQTKGEFITLQSPKSRLILELN